jgi:hypothetical protein
LRSQCVAPHLGASTRAFAPAARPLSACPWPDVVPDVGRQELPRHSGNAGVRVGRLARRRERHRVVRVEDEVAYAADDALEEASTRGPRD